ncbi:phage tail protein [Bacillus sp. MCCB 382]|uniref:phage tail tube protein n=1 Tax=Bacillus sp. MCCB 382 TaxID=2860197 RepID=UPI001C576B26|nr:phage tail protein [Bacillus sp. MCCB 382]
MPKNVKIVLLVNTGDETTPVFSPVGGQRNATFSEEAETIDLTSEDSAGYQEFDYGLGSWTIECDGLYIPTAEGYKALKDAQRNKLIIKARIQEDGQPVEEGDVLVTSRELEGAYDGESTYNVSLQGSGKLAAVPAS